MEVVDKPEGQMERHASAPSHSKQTVCDSFGVYYNWEVSFSVNSFTVNFNGNIKNGILIVKSF